MIREPVPIDQLVEAWTDRRTESPPLSRKAVPSYGPSVDEPQETIQIRNPRTATAALTSLAGAFCRLYEQGGHTYLQGGTITGSNGGEVTIDDYKVIDSGDTPPLSDSGDRLYLKCNVTATVVDGVILPGVQLNNAGTELTKTLPTAHTFTAANKTGDVFVEVGRWNDSEFLPAGRCGLSTVTGCATSYGIS